MKLFTLTLFLLVSLVSCQTKTDTVTGPEKIDIIGTWKLVTGTVITKGVSAITDYTKDQEMIKIINSTHFAFLKRPTTVKPDTTNKFDAGGGRYKLTGDHYTEHLDFYNDKQYQGTTYHFVVMIKGDTLIQQGKEGVDRSIIEKYVKLK